MSATSMPRGTRRAIAGLFMALAGVGAASALAAPEDARTTIIFDRTLLHRQAVQESLQPVHPGSPKGPPFWNIKARSFMYAPAFEFKVVPGATRYRFTATAYGTRSWSFDTVEPASTLEAIWRDLPPGRLLVERVPLDDRGNVRWSLQDLRAGRWIEKTTAAGPAPIVDLPADKPAPRYRFTAWAAKELRFEADRPWAPLGPIWKDVPVGEVVVRVEGLDRSDKPIGFASIQESRNEASRTFRRFHRKAVFGGPYQEAAADYRESAYRWLDWLAANDFKEWQTGGPRHKLQYPSKFVGAAVSGMTALASMERSAQRSTQDLRMAASAARALIEASFPADWGLAYFPPTYSDEAHAVMMKYPAMVGEAYLDLYEAGSDKGMLDAARRIADTYRKTQLPSGSWPLLMDARSGERLARSTAELVPIDVLTFVDRLVSKHGMGDYRPMAEAAWRQIQRETVASFRFEGQFEDTTRGGSSEWNLSILPACSVAVYLLKHRGDAPTYMALAEEILRFAEDQFVIWEQAVPGDVNRDQFPRLPFTPAALEQYRYMVPVSGMAAQMMAAFQAAYEATGKELYLAKAAALANAMTVLQKTNGGSYVGTFWNPGGPGDWPNVHAYAARALADFGEMLRRRKLRVQVLADAAPATK